MLSLIFVSAALAASQPAYNQPAGYGFLAGKQIAPVAACSRRCTTVAAQSTSTFPCSNGNGLINSNGESPTSPIDFRVLDAPPKQFILDCSSGMVEGLLHTTTLCGPLSFGSHSGSARWFHGGARTPSVPSGGILAHFYYEQHGTTSMIPPFSGDDWSLSCPPPHLPDLLISWPLALGWVHATPPDLTRGWRSVSREVALPLEPLFASLPPCHLLLPPPSDLPARPLGECRFTADISWCHNHATRVVVQGGSRHPLNEPEPSRAMSFALRMAMLPVSLMVHLYRAVACVATVVVHTACWLINWSIYLSAYAWFVARFTVFVVLRITYVFVWNHFALFCQTITVALAGSLYAVAIVLFLAHSAYAPSYTMAMMQWGSLALCPTDVIQCAVSTGMVVFYALCAVARPVVRCFVAASAPTSSTPYALLPFAPTGWSPIATLPRHYLAPALAPWLRVERSLFASCCCWGCFHLPRAAVMNTCPCAMLPLSRATESRT